MDSVADVSWVCMTRQNLDLSVLLPAQSLSTALCGDRREQSPGKDDDASQDVKNSVGLSQHSTPSPFFSQNTQRDFTTRQAKLKPHTSHP
jgi:hypothetical protein